MGYLDCVANPLGFVEALVDFWTPRHNVTIHLLDMGGIASVERDVAHVLACDVLGVECTDDHWLPDFEEPFIENARSGDPELIDKELEAMEWILQQQDCAYRQQIMAFTKASTTTPHLQLYYADKFWDSCEEHDLGSSSFSNTTYLLDLLQSQAGCGHLSQNTIDDLRSQSRTTNPLNQVTTEPSRQPIHEPGVPVALNMEISLGLGTSHLVEPWDSQVFSSYDTKLYASSSQVMAVFTVMMVFVGFLFRRLKIPYPLPGRRWDVRVRDASTTKRYDTVKKKDCIGN